MSILSRLIFQAPHWRARKTARDDILSLEEKKEAARQLACGARRMAIGICGTWVRFRCTELHATGVKGEIDLVGYHGETLAFVEIRTRTVSEVLSALPELSVTAAKQQVLVRAARGFLSDGVSAMASADLIYGRDNFPGRPPVARLYKYAFSPQLQQSLQGTS